MARKSSYAVEEESLPPNFGLSGVLGNSLAFGEDNRWGFLAAFRYNNEWENRTEQRRTFAATDDGLELADSLTVRRTAQDIRLEWLFQPGAGTGGCA